MIGKTVALIQVPNQALFSLRAAARYLGLDPDTLRADTDAGQIPCYEFHGRRTYKLEDLEELRAQLVRWENRPHPKAAAPRREI